MHRGGPPLTGSVGARAVGGSGATVTGQGLPSARARRAGSTAGALTAVLAAATLLATPGHLAAQNGAAPDPGPAATTLDGVFTAEQAARGEAVFSETCAHCHATSRFTGPAFVPSWRQAPLSTLFTVIRSQMPFDNPGSLEPEAYAAVIAYIFRLNGLPAGDRALPAHADSLRNITIQFEPEPDAGSDG